MAALEQQQSLEEKMFLHLHAGVEEHDHDHVGERSKNMRYNATPTLSGFVMSSSSTDTMRVERLGFSEPSSGPEQRARGGALRTPRLNSG